ncbi:hypothetical protein KUTeg_001347 [Tegillarca granosa]|uniref:Tubulin polyglutamylase complex subunit 1-like C-terminal domain-containing protein n=1 Tax=Tegillarca granosa TaxID=220873 RepID=A0ABQ9FRA0_TEGGR|nr:hypothetical protein KUTeg_001347 [Tegillarca granosa]
MADKRKPNSADDRPLETDRQFLERTSVGGLMRDVLDKLISNRPEDPIGFLADYFDTLEDQSNHVLRARQVLLMTHHSRPVFESNVRMAYDILKKHKVSKKLHGVNGHVYTDLIKSLCRIVESGYNLGPDGLFYALERAMKRDQRGHGVQTLEHFTVEACEAFLLKV